MRYKKFFQPSDCYSEELVFAEDKVDRRLANAKCNPMQIRRKELFGQADPLYFALERAIKEAIPTLTEFSGGNSSDELDSNTVLSWQKQGDAQCTSLVKMKIFRRPDERTASLELIILKKGIDKLSRQLGQEVLPDIKQAIQKTLVYATVKTPYVAENQCELI